MTSAIVISLTLEELQELIKTAVQEAYKEIKDKAATVKEEEIYLTRKEVIEILGITYPTLSKHIHDGKLKAYYLGRRVRFKKSELEKALKAYYH